MGISLKTMMKIVKAFSIPQKIHIVVTLRPFLLANPHGYWVKSVQRFVQLIATWTKSGTIGAFKHWMTLDMTNYHTTFTPRELARKLKTQGLTGDEVFAAVEQAKVRRRSMQSDREFLRKHRQEWRSLLTPLRQELNHARGGMRYDEDDVLRTDAFEAYTATLEQMYYKLLALSETLTDGRKSMPSETAAYLNELHAETGKGFRIPNRGAHWVDWTPPKRREQVEQAFHDWMGSGTRKKKAKGKTPFLRIDRGDRFETKRQRLLGAATKERDTLTLKYEIAMQGVRQREAMLSELHIQPEPDKKALHLRLAQRLEKANKAIALLRRWTQDAGALPRTWHGVLTME